MKRNYSKKANIILGLVIAGILVSYPYKDSVYGGIFTAFFTASMIAGFADWFAVTALFRKPLKISSSKYIRTEIIPRNRERIFKMLTETVQKDLLSKETLKSKVNEYKVSDLLVNYLSDQEGKKHLKKITIELLQDLLHTLDPEAVSSLLKELITDKSREIQLSPYLAKAVEWTMLNGYDQRVIDFIIDEIIRLIGTQEVKDYLADQINNALYTYQKGVSSREWIVNFLKKSGFSSKDIANVLIEKLIGFLDDIKSPHHPVRTKIQNRLIKLLNNLKTDTQLQEKIEAWKNEQLTNLNIRPQIEEFFKGYAEVAAGNSETKSKWMTRIENQIDRLVDNLQNNTLYQMKIEQVVKQTAYHLIETKHHQLGQIVNGNLAKYNPERLVELIEKKVGNDLQIIRINGSIIGGLAGVIIYLLGFVFS